MFYPTIRYIYALLFAIFRMFYKVWHGNDPVHKIQMPKVPWLWIGAVYPHETLDVTASIDSVVRSGDRVDSDYLTSVTGCSPIVWKYLDGKTLEEEEFPSKGFVISGYEESDEHTAFKNDSS